MKLVVKILKWMGISILSLLFLVILLRNELFIGLMKMNSNSQLAKPYEMLELPHLEDSTFRVLSAEFELHALQPEAYILREFETHSILFLGEYHRIRHDALFVQGIIPQLYSAGIKDLAMELALAKDSLLIRDVITNEDFFDQKKANLILFHMSPLLGFAEIIDIFRAAWALNQSLPNDAEPFQIHGLMHEVDFSIFESQKDLDLVDAGKASKELSILFRKGVENPEEYMASCIMSSLVNQNKKALVFCGMHHAFTGYEGHGRRVGNIIKDQIGDQAMTISLHSPWRAKEGKEFVWMYPVNGTLDAFIRRYNPESLSFGMNVNNSAFGRLEDTCSQYINKEVFMLKDFCDGYIYLNSFNKIEGVHAQKKFINRKNIKETKAAFPNVDMRNGLLRFMGPKSCNALINIDPDNLHLRFRHLY